MSINIGSHGEQQPDDGLHPNHAWVFADDADRIAFVPSEGDPSTLVQMQARWPADIYKEAVVAGTNARWMLVGNAPTWVESTPGSVLASANKVEYEVRKNSAGTIAVGQLVYVAGFNAGLDISLVELAQADADATMDAIGVCSVEITNTVTGKVMVTGVIRGLDTSAWVLNQNLHVSATVAGQLEGSPPPGPAIHQNIAMVARVNPADGAILVIQQGQEPYGFPPEPVNPVPTGAAAAPGTSPHTARLDHVHELENRRALMANFTSGVFAGGELSTGAGAGEMSIADGNGQTVSYADPNDPALAPFAWAGLTDFAISAIATTQSTFLFVTPGGAVLQVSGSLPSNAQYRDNVFLGWCTHPDHVNISQIIQAPALAYNAAQDWKTVVRTLEPLLLSGFEVSGNASLTMAVGAGTFFSEGVSFQPTPERPSDGVFPGADPLTFARIYSDGTSGGDTEYQAEAVTSLDPTRVENSGTLNIIPGSPNQATIQRLYADPGGNPYWAYGQTVLPNLIDAVALAGNEPFVESALMQSSQLLGRWCLIASAFDLTDPLQQLFIPSSGLGSGGPGGGGGGATQFLQLTDTPASYVGQAGFVPVVNAGETGLTFIDAELAIFGAADLDEPNNADWAIDAIAPIGADAANPMLVTRRFDDTEEQGVGMDFMIPGGATNIVLLLISKAGTAPGGSTQVQPVVYGRQIRDNNPMPSWSAGVLLTAANIPANANFQYHWVLVPLASLGLIAGENAFVELTRRGTEAADGLVGDWVLYAIGRRFT